MNAPRLAYLDTSAFLKLVLRETESDALRRALIAHPQCVSSDILVVEALRAARRHGLRAVRRAAALLAGVWLLPVSRTVRSLAAVADPFGLRSLDAIHLATALTIRGHLGRVIAYDRRLLDAAVAFHLPAQAPGA